jgi:glycosyltransferase involved in cell wall biosynthesis
MPVALPQIVVVMPVFNEEAVLPELFVRLAAVFEAHPECAWRAILVDDGSRDGSAALVRAQAGRDPRFQLLELSRNFGFQSALSAGLAAAAPGEAVVTMDADLQDPPEVIPELVAAWQGGAEVVRAVRRTRREHGLRRFGLDLFHALFGRLSDFPVEPNTGPSACSGRRRWRRSTLCRSGTVSFPACGPGWVFPRRRCGTTARNARRGSRSRRCGGWCGTPSTASSASRTCRCAC